MVRHIVMWNFVDEISESAKPETAMRIKNELEALLGVVDGLLEISVVTPIKGSSSFELVLNSLFCDEKALSDYQVHPEHVKAASFIKSVTQGRKCIDFYEG